MIGTPNRQQAWINFAQLPREQGGLGLAPHQAAGLVGNLVNESGQDLNPWGPTGDNGTAWGTAQWRGDRLARLKALPNYQTIEGQQAFMRQELDGPEAKAYKALQAAQSPEEAARAWDAFYERSDGSTRSKREASARALMDQFGGGGAPDTGALSYAATGNTGSKMASPALSPDELAGPGALSQPGIGYGSGDRVADGLMGIGASLAGISSPEQANAITRMMLASQKVPAEQGTWSIHQFPNGQAAWINNKTMAMKAIGNFGKTDQSQTAGEKEAEKLEANRANDQFTSHVKMGDDARARKGTLEEMRSLVEDPEVAQGPVTGNLVGLNQVMGAKGADKQARLQALAKTEELDNASRMKGAVSDYERKLQSQAIGFGPTQNKEANLRALDAMERAREYREARADYYQKISGGKPMGDAAVPLLAEFDRQWEADHPFGTPKAAGGRKPLGDIFKH